MSLVDKPVVMIVLFMQFQQFLLSLFQSFSIYFLFDSLSLPFPLLHLLFEILNSIPHFVPFWRVLH